MSDEATSRPNAALHDGDLTDPVQGARIPLRLVYPTSSVVRTESIGPYTLDVARDGVLVGARLPLVIVSHGTGGTSLVHRGLAVHLARAGFVVSLVDHPGNHRSDDSLAGTVANLENRPRHVCLAIDAAFADPVVGPALSPDGVGVIGQSIGGYTALAVAGGRPTAFPHETLDGRARPVAVTADPRVRALVLLTPATGWFMAPGSLSDVDVPILMRTGEKDTHTPAFHADIVIRSVRDPAKIDAQVVPNAGHFSFHTPFPPAMVRPEFPPAHDPDGFDRVAWQPIVNGEIEAFLRRNL